GIDPRADVALGAPGPAGGIHMSDSVEHKIVVLGSMGAGKSTLVRAIAKGHDVDTDVANTDAASSKLATTVAMDYADVDLPNGDRMRVFGTPGQERFSFIWPILLEGAAGAVILLDASEPEPAAALDRYLAVLAAHAARVPAVVGLTKCDLADPGVMPEMATRTLAAGLPLVPFDAREASQILMLMDVLMTQIEMHDLVADHG